MDHPVILILAAILFAAPALIRLWTGAIVPFFSRDRKEEQYRKDLAFWAMGKRVEEREAKQEEDSIRDDAEAVKLKDISLSVSVRQTLKNNRELRKMMPDEWWKLPNNDIRKLLFQMIKETAKEKVNNIKLDIKQ